MDLILSKSKHTNTTVKHAAEEKVKEITKHVNYEAQNARVSHAGKTTFFQPRCQGPRDPIGGATIAPGLARHSSVPWESREASR